MAQIGTGKKMLLIGGSGFVSGTLARRAVAAGHAVWAVTRGDRELPEHVVHIRADRNDHAALERAVKAAGVRWDLTVDVICYEPEQMHHDVAFLPSHTDHLVFISTDFVFDPTHRVFPQTAETTHYATEGYGGKKRICETILAGADTGGMGWTVFRPCHIYGPGSQLGCLPAHGRDPDLIDRMRRGESLKLAGGGRFLQQPIYVSDLADLILSVPSAPAANRRVFCSAGPDIVESIEYYRIITNRLEVDLQVEEIGVDAYLREHPESRPFMCHRIYDLDPIRVAGLTPPSTPLATGLTAHVESLL